MRLSPITQSAILLFGFFTWLTLPYTSEACVLLIERHFPFYYDPLVFWIKALQYVLWPAWPFFAAYLAIRMSLILLVYPFRIFNDRIYITAICSGFLPLILLFFLGFTLSGIR